MSPSELKATIAPVLTDCVSFVDSVLSPERADATKYYNGEPFGNEEEGRSQIVLTELRDTVGGIAPDLMKLFFGPERVVEFLPKTAASAASAKQYTDYVHFCFTQRNAGFLETLSVLKDGLVRKLGIFKTWWDDSTQVRALAMTNVTDEELDVIASREDMNMLGVTDNKDGTHTVHVTQRMPGRLRVKAVPPEEFLYNRSARDTDTQFVVLAHRMEKTRSELIALGISEKDIDEYGADSTLPDSEEAISRQADNTSLDKDEPAGKANEKYEYIESYFRVDVDGDDIAELRQVCSLGPSYHVVNGDGLGVPVEDHPFALFIPDPEPHTLHGSSVADRVMDLQKMKSAVFRAQADALSLSLFPRLAYVEGQVNVNDILNNDIGAPIRMRSLGAVTPIEMPYSGEMADAMLNRLDAIVEQRTGRRKGVEGLDADALQSTTAQGVDAAVAGARAQTEMLARVFAEMTLKPLFTKMYRLLRQNQPAEVVKLRDKMVQVDPQKWDRELDVTVNVALGSTLVERKLATIVAATQKQEQVLQLLGPQNPITSLAQYAATLQRGVELGGFPDVESFFSSVDPNWQPPQQQPQPTPEQTLAQAQLQIEQMRVQKDLQIKEAELMLKKEQQEQEHQRQIAKDAADIALRRMEIEYKYGAGNLAAEMQQAEAQAEQMLTRERTEAEMTLAAQQQAHDQQLAREQQDHDQQLAREQQAHEQSMAEQSAASESASE